MFITLNGLLQLSLNGQLPQESESSGRGFPSSSVAHMSDDRGNIGP